MAKKKVSNKGMNKNLVIGIVVVLLLIGVFWYFNNQKEVGLSPGIPPMDGPGDGGDDIVEPDPTEAIPVIHTETRVAKCSGIINNPRTILNIPIENSKAIDLLKRSLD